VLIGISNLLVAQCNFTVMFFYPVWFQSVQGTTASEAGLHVFPNAAAMSFGSLFAGWMLKKTGKYKALNVIFGIFPTAAAIMIANLHMNSPILAQWISIIPLGFGNAVVLQTTLIALLASIEPAHLAVGMGFAQLFRGIGQVSGVGGASAIFQFLLNKELRKRFTGPGSEELVQRIRHSAQSVHELPPDLRLAARESYAVSLRAVFYFAAACTFIAFLIRLPIPELSLDQGVKPAPSNTANQPPVNESRVVQGDVERPFQEHRTVGSDDDDDEFEEDDSVTQPLRRALGTRRLSTYESDDGRDPDHDD